MGSYSHIIVYFKFILSSSIKNKKNLLNKISSCLYQVIRNHPSALEIYQNKLLESGQIAKEDIERIRNKVNNILNEEFMNSKDYVPKKRDWLSAYWTGFKTPEQISRIRNTGYIVFFWILYILPACCILLIHHLSYHIDLQS